MWDRILSMFNQIIEFAFSTFTTLMDAVPGAWSTVFTLIIITLIVRFILAPLFSGGSGSDSAKKKGDGDD